MVGIKGNIDQVEDDVDIEEAIEENITNIGRMQTKDKGPVLLKKPSTLNKAKAPELKVT